MATKEDRSLSAGMSLPKWMKKTKINDRFDLEQNTFSPSELDDSFMYYYRYPKPKEATTTGNTVTVNVTDSKIVTPVQGAAVTNPGSDFSKIVENGQRFIEASKTLHSKPKGTDDGFKGEPATVGSSVIKVAHQMVSGKAVTTETPPDEQCEQLLAKFDPYRRRGSRSLPASPLTSPRSSPKLKRRGVNKFFTTPYSEGILSNLLAKRNISASISYINEESKEELVRAASTMSVDESVAIKQKVFKAKASELREMNFWSPTSM